MIGVTLCTAHNSRLISRRARYFNSIIKWILLKFHINYHKRTRLTYHNSLIFYSMFFNSHFPQQTHAFIFALWTTSTRLCCCCCARVMRRPRQSSSVQWWWCCCCIAVRCVAAGSDDLSLSCVCKQCVPVIDAAASEWSIALPAKSPNKFAAWIGVSRYLRRISSFVVLKSEWVAM